MTLATVLRVQVQRSPLKPGPRGARTYDPAPLLEVGAAEVGPAGLVGLVGDERVVDAHHADHPQSRNVRGINGLSLLPLAHYAELRERFGPHAVDGCAGESLLLDTAGPLGEADLAGTLLLETDGDPLTLSAVQAAQPCLEFTRWLLGLGADAPVDDDVQDAMAFLRDGRRGFYLQVRGTGRVTAGARLTRA